MIAVLKTGGKQYKVSENDVIKIEKIDGEVGGKAEFNEILLVSDNEGNEVKIGTPFLTGAKVIAQIKAQDKAKKIDVIKFKNKIRYHRKYGHRQPFTEIVISEIKA